MPTLTIAEAQQQLPEIIDHLQPGEEIAITRDEKTVARILPPVLPRGMPVYGRGKGMIVSYLDDDEHLKDFARHFGAN